MKIQEKTQNEELLDSLKQQHGQLSSDLQQLLSFNFQKRLKVLQDEYKDYQRTYTRRLEEEEQTIINEFLDVDLETDILKEEGYKNLIILFDKIEKLLVFARLQKEEKQLRFQDKEEFFQKLYDTYPNHQNLSLVANSLGTYSVEDLQEMLKELPEDVEVLNLRSNKIFSQKRRFRKNIALHLPKNLRYLRLGANDLGSMEIQNIQYILQHIPRSVTGLDLSESSLGSLGFGGIRVVLKALPRNLKSVNLNGNYFPALPLEDWKTLFSHLPKKIECLELGHLNSGRKYSAESFAAMIELLPKSIKYLNLRDNEFYRFSADGIKMIFGNIGPNIYRLDLSAFLQEKKDVDYVCECFSAIPDNVTYLHLSYNHLHMYSAEELRQIFGSLHKNIKYLNIAGNMLNIFEKVQYKYIFSLLPKSVRVLDMSQDSLSGIRPKDLGLDEKVTIIA